jgi:elongation factor Tu
MPGKRHANITKLADEAAAINWPEGSDGLKEDRMVMPGDNVEMECILHHPIAIETGQRFNVREGGRTVATGLITRLIDTKP